MTFNEFCMKFVRWAKRRSWMTIVFFALLGLVAIVATGSVGFHYELSKLIKVATIILVEAIFYLPLIAITLVKFAAPTSRANQPDVV